MVLNEEIFRVMEIAQLDEEKFYHMKTQLVLDVRTFNQLPVLSENSALLLTYNKGPNFSYRLTYFHPDLLSNSSSGLGSFSFFFRVKFLCYTSSPKGWQTCDNVVLDELYMPL